MTNTRKVLSIILLLWILIMLFFFIYQSLGFEKQPSVVVVRLVDNNLEFGCLGNINFNCLPNISLKNIEQPVLYIDSAFYRNSSILDIILVRSDQIFVLLEIELKNNQVKYITLPKETLPPLRIAYTDTQVIIGDQTGHVLFIQNGDMKSRVKLTSKSNISVIGGLFVRDNDIVVFSPTPMTENQRTYAQVWLIRLSDYSIEGQLLQMPNFDHLEIGELPQSGKKYLFRIVGVSEDLANVYGFYYLGTEENAAQSMLGIFDTSTLKEISSLNVECPNMVGYSESNGILYSSRSDLEESSIATFINLHNLSSFNMSIFTQDETTTKLIIVPFGGNFLFGTNSRVFIVSPAGKIVKKYNLPLTWHNENYVLFSVNGQ